MKTSIAMIAAGLIAGLALNVHSQGLTPKSPVDKLRDIKAKNAELIEKQKATLEKLDDMDKQADQMRIFSKRG